MAKPQGLMFLEYLLCIQRISARASTTYILQRTEEPFGFLHVA